MSFRGRLRLFFGIIVVIPMVAMGVALFVIAGQSERGKADAGIDTALQTALQLDAEGRRAATSDLRAFARDRQLLEALRRGNRSATAVQLRRLTKSRTRVAAATVKAANRPPVRVGSPLAVAPAMGALRTRSGRRLGVLAVSVTDGPTFVRGIRVRTGQDAAVLLNGKPVTGTRAGAAAVPARARDFKLDGETFRGRRGRSIDAAGMREEIAVFRRVDSVNASIASSRRTIVALVAVFLALALASSVLVVRRLQRQIERFLDAARRLAAGRFDEPVEIDGHDEFAQLGVEFNRMSEQLSAKIEEVDSQRDELTQTIRRVGKAFAAGLDPRAALELTVQTAVDACEAECGHLQPLPASGLVEVRAGAGDPTLRHALKSVQRRLALQAQTGDPEDSGPSHAVAIEQGEVHAIGVMMRARIGPYARPRAIGQITIARRGRHFGTAQREIFEYLAAQAVVSVENANLHETVRRQAATDELTGLANLRELHGALDREFERGRRYDTDLGFVLLDIDDFKQVNDQYGHLQGDEVLRQVSRVLLRLSREMDEPARYGGEELAIVLPQTELDGALRLAERIRVAVEALAIPAVVEGDPDVRVTASFGVASVPASAARKSDLVAAADDALYRAKREGKNRVSYAGVTPVQRTS